MSASNYHIYVPVKDSLPTAERALRALSSQPVTVWNDYSTPENTERLHQLADELQFRCVDVASLTEHPSPNYRLLLITAQRECLENGQSMVIVESDVIVSPSTISRLVACERSRVGLIAAVTTDDSGTINFPYEYAKRIKEDGVCNKRLSFCCTMLTNELLRAYDFNELDPNKNWYDVHISHVSRRLGLENILQVSNLVLHLPHSSRPWKQLKYTNPLLYYWRKLTQRRDKI